MTDFNVVNKLHEIKAVVCEIKGQAPTPEIPTIKQKFDFLALFKELGNFLSELTTNTSQRADDTKNKIEVLEREILNKKTMLTKLRENSQPELQKQLVNTEQALQNIIDKMEDIKKEIDTSKHKLSLYKGKKDVASKDVYTATKDHLQSIIRNTKKFIDDFEGQQIRDSDLTSRIISIYAKHFATNIQRLPETKRAPLQRELEQIKEMPRPPINRGKSVSQIELGRKVGELNLLEQRVAQEVNIAETRQGIHAEMKAAMKERIRSLLKVQEGSQFVEDPFINRILDNLQDDIFIKNSSDKLFEKAAQVRSPAERNRLLAEEIKSWFQIDSISRLIVREGQKVIQPQIEKAQNQTKSKVQEELKKYPLDFIQEHKIDQNLFNLVDTRANQLMSLSNDLAYSEQELKKFNSEWSENQIPNQIINKVRETLVSGYRPIVDVYDAALRTYGVYSHEVTQERQQALYGNSASVPENVKSPEQALPLILRLKELSRKEGASEATLEAAILAQKRLPTTFNAFKERFVSESQKFESIKEEDQKVQFLRYALEDAQTKFGGPSLVIPNFTGMTYQQALNAIKAMPTPSYGTMEPQAAGELNKRMSDYRSSDLLTLQMQFRTERAAENFEAKSSAAKESLESILAQPAWKMLSDEERLSIRNDFEGDHLLASQSLNDPRFTGTVEKFHAKWQRENINKVIGSKLPDFIDKASGTISKNAIARLDGTQITDPAIREEVIKTAQAKEQELRKRIGSSESDDQKALLRDIRQFDPEERIVDVSKKNLRQRFTELISEIESQEKNMTYEYSLDENGKAALHKELEARVYKPLEVFEKELDTLKPEEVQQKIRAFEQFQKDNSKVEQLIQVNDPTLRAKLDEEYVLIHSPLMTKGLNTISELLKRFSLETTEEVEQLKEQAKAAKTPQDVQAVLQGIEKINARKTDILKAGLKNKLQAAQEASENAAIASLIPPKGLLEGNKRIMAAKDQFQNTLSRFRSMQAQIDQARHPEHLAKLYDEKLSALLEKKSTPQDPLPLHHSDIKQPYQEFVKEVAKASRRQLQRELITMRDDIILMFDERTKSQSAKLTNREEKAAFEQRANQFKENLRNQLNEKVNNDNKTIETLKAYEERLEKNPEASAAIMEGFFNSSIATGSLRDELYLFAQDQYQKQFRF